MSRYRRAPLCRFCWDRGHTSLHCPEAKAKAEKAKLALERNEPISYKESDALEIVERIVLELHRICLWTQVLPALSYA